MNIRDYQRHIRGATSADITSDEPHVSLRCAENGVTFERIKRLLLQPSASLLRLVEDRPGVYKLYYRFGKRRELKVVLDMHTRGKLNVRTVKLLSERHRRLLERTNVLIAVEAFEEHEEQYDHD